MVVRLLRGPEYVAILHDFGSYEINYIGIKSTVSTDNSVDDLNQSARK